jgi:hypothetical protein
MTEYDKVGTSQVCGLDIDQAESATSADLEEKAPKYSAYMQALGFRDVSETEEKGSIPDLTYFELFRVFLWFGCRAFGGPVAQIALMKQELVTEQKWISNEKFNRVYAVYQILPGPEV